MPAILPMGSESRNGSSSSGCSSRSPSGLTDFAASFARPSTARDWKSLGAFSAFIIALFAVLGIQVIVSAGSFLTVYLGIEIMSLSLYAMVAFDRDDGVAAESAMKYFVLGALSSGLLLYGASLIYGFTGTTSFAALAGAFGGPAGPETGLVVGLVFLIAGLAFKVSAAPFHMWTPDVYEGAPTPVTAFFAAAPKVAAMALFLRVLIQPFGDLVAQWQQIIVFIAIASMALGAVAGYFYTQADHKMVLPDDAEKHFTNVMVRESLRHGTPGQKMWSSLAPANDAADNDIPEYIRTLKPQIEEFFTLIGLDDAMGRAVAVAKAVGRMVAVITVEDVGQIHPSIAKSLAKTGMILGARYREGAIA